MSTPFQLLSLPMLSRSTVDRYEGLRADSEGLRARWSDARVLVLDEKARTPVHVSYSADADEVALGASESVLATRKAISFGEDIPDAAFYLGQWHGVDHWSLSGAPEGEIAEIPVRRSWGVTEKVPQSEGESWVSLIGHGDLLDGDSAGLFTAAVALRNWHRSARFCAVCGGVNKAIQFGWAARCDSCGREEYPRTDPAVICLVHDEVGVNGEHVLLARHPKWPQGRYSLLAGFVEAGESLENGIRREIFEEVGVQVRDPRYLGSQPWPFPRSTMLGFAARADKSASFSLAEEEIEEARWVSRAEVRAIFERRTQGKSQSEASVADGAEAMLLPGNSSIARSMLEAWVAADV